MNPSADNPQTFAPEFPAIDDYIDSDQRPLLTALKELAVARGLAVYLVGGCVRDLLLGLPINDLDIVVLGNAPQLAKDVAGLLGGHYVAHDRFGTATISLGESNVDLVTARREKYPQPGALPFVEPASLKEDLARRDFSINAMAVPLNAKKPVLIDPLCGKADLKKGLIRTLHSESFRDDPTRLLRAVRYEQRLGFQLARDTEQQLKSAVHGGFLVQVSGDRIRHELERIFEEAHPEKALVRAVELGVLQSIFAPLNRPDWVTRWGSVAHDIDPAGEAGRLGWLAALAFPLTPQEGEGLIQRLNMPLEMALVVRNTIQLREMAGALAQPYLRPSELSGCLKGMGVEALKVVAGIADTDRVTERLIYYLAELRHIDVSLGGNDLLDLGVPVGPAVGQVLSRLRCARLNGEVNDEGEERQWVKRILAEGCLDSWRQ